MEEDKRKQDENIWKQIEGIVVDIHRTAKVNGNRIASMDAEIAHLKERGVSNDTVFYRGGSLYRHVPYSEPEYITRDPNEQKDLLLRTQRGERLSKLVAVRNRKHFELSHLLTNLRLLHSHLE